jgi:aryl-alcohol dehydrogenase-like predicted oxidoreductase
MASLKALSVDTVDLVQMHQYWPIWDAEGYWLEELARLKEQGYIRFIGLSLPDHRHDLATRIVQTGQIDSIQTIVNIFDPIAFDSLVPLCQQANVAVIARCILDEGGLTGFLTHETKFEEGDFRQRYFDALPRELYLERVERLRSYIPRYANTLTDLAIRFVLSHQGITTAITSMHIPAYADENIAAADLPPLPEAVFEEIRRHQRWVRNFYEAHYW